MTQFRKLLTDLDTLTDTRLGTLEALNPEAASRAVKTEAYWLREYDDWTALTGGLVDNATFVERYKHRDMDVLMRSVMTGVSAIILQLLAMADANALHGMGDSLVGLEVNIAPYTLTTEELDELRVILQSIYSKETPISFCHVPLSELTATYLRQHYAMAVMYGFHEWIVQHDRDLMSARTPCFNFIGPKLFQHDPRHLSVEQKQDEFTRLRLFKLEFMDFEFVDVKHMSMYRPTRQGSSQPT